MGILNGLLSRGSNSTMYSDPDELRMIWDNYSNQWPRNNVRYEFWKPDSVLPAPKWVIKRAMKLCYAEWPQPIDRTVFGVFFMEFADLALHLVQEKYEAIKKFSSRRIKVCGEEDEGDPLVMFRLTPTLAHLSDAEEGNRNIVRIRDGFRRSAAWDPVDVNDDELDLVRRSLLESTTEYYTLIQEWRFYILSIGRDQYTENLPGSGGP